MRDRGFEYPQGTYDTLPAELFLPRPFGVWTMAEAQQRGYHGPDTSEATHPVNDLIENMPDSERAAFMYSLNGIGAPPAMKNFPNGMPAAGTDGCLQLALNGIFEDYDQYESTRESVEELAVDADARTNADIRVTGAVAEWAACMQGAGYHYKTPADAAVGGIGDTITETEIEQAVADVGCKTRVGLMRTWYEVRAGVEEDVLELNAGLVAKLQEYRSLELAEPNDVP